MMMMMTLLRCRKKMKVDTIFFSFALFLLIFNHVKLQRFQYASRFRNVSISSETGSGYLINMSIFVHRKDHRVSCDFNITKDIYTKKIYIEIQRCMYERFTCEYFQTWKFNENIKAILSMKNQMWTPIFDCITPKLNFPLLKKNVYRANNCSFDAEKVMAFYNEANKFYWKAAIAMYDNNGKISLGVHYELNIFEYVDRLRNKTRNKS